MNGNKAFTKAKKILDTIHSNNNETELERLYEPYLALIRKAAYQGNADAQFELGQFYEMPILIQTKNKRFNLQKSKYWYRKACDNASGDACLALANHYAAGSDANTSKELDLLLKSCALGTITAADNLALLFKNRGDYQESLKWLHLSLERVPGNGDTLAELAKFYYEGLGVKKSYQKAYHLFREAGTSNYITEYSKEEVLFYIGKMYFYGQYLEQSFSKAKYLFEQANKDADHEDITTFCDANAEILQSVRKTKVIL